MKLQEFFATVAPFLEGHVEHAEAVRALYGSPSGAHEKDAKRLEIYGRFCRVHRFEVVESIYPHCRREMVERLGAAGWAELVEEYFRRHPMQHPEMNANASEFPAFLTAYRAEAPLPEWLPELADLEWWEWQAWVAPDDEAGGERPRVASAVELRPYRWDLVSWLDAKDERPAEPELQEVLVLFWRNRRERFRRENVTPLELLVLKAVSEGLPLEELAAQVGGVSSEQLEATLGELVEAGIILA
jgi:hypothetical protein